MSPAKKLWWVIVAFALLCGVLYSSGKVVIQTFDGRGQDVLDPRVIAADPPITLQDYFWVPWGGWTAPPPSPQPPE